MEYRIENRDGTFRSCVGWSAFKAARDAAATLFGTAVVTQTDAVTTLHHPWITSIVVRADRAEDDT